MGRGGFALKFNDLALMLKIESIQTWLRWPRLWRLLVVGLLIWFYLLLPDPLFHQPYSTVIEARDGQLLSAQIADDGQWRFPEVDSVPEQLATSILLFEDEYFHWHPGVNPASLFRAAIQNWKAGRTMSGGSTISMQVIRLSRKGQARTYVEKAVELILAMRLEFTYSKSEILGLYASHAPYGGNVVGVEAASWRYFQRPVDQLSTAEYAMLAVLPNAPSLIHLGKNRKALEQKRNRLLQKLHARGVIDEWELSLAIMEPIPERPRPIPNAAYHLLDRAISEGKKGKRVMTTIDEVLQRELSNTVDRYVNYLSQNEVHNACAMVVSLVDGSVMAYVGNARVPATRAPFVDLIRAPRSSGSILKPFLYGLAVQEGLIHPTTLLRDVPIQIGKFAPQNFDRSFQGVVTADKALSSSLNIPATLLLKEYGLIPFYRRLQWLGFSTINRSASNYGLSLILGGAEVTLFDLANAYAWQARGLRSACELEHAQGGLRLFGEDRYEAPKLDMDPGTWFQVSTALSEVNRPGLEEHWRRFSSARKVSWKTGTSHGHRDAWAVGYDQSYLVAVWVGNADGEGRPGLTGTSTAAPLMFETFSKLEDGGWFCEPEAFLEPVELCATSGLTPSENCPIRVRRKTLVAGVLDVCHMHQRVLIDEHGQRVYRHCARDFTDSSWFVLDPVAAYFYEKRDPTFKNLPPFSEACAAFTEESPLAIIYPNTGAQLFAPRDLDGKVEKVVLHATHLQADAILYWHLDNQFLGTTRGDHRMVIDPIKGQHHLKLMDEKGMEANCRFELVVEH